MIRDANILLSYINTKLRDEYASLEELAEDLNLEQAEIELILNGAGYFYNAKINQFTTEERL